MARLLSSGLLSVALCALAWPGSAPGTVGHEPMSCCQQDHCSSHQGGPAKAPPPNQACCPGCSLVYTDTPAPTALSYSPAGGETVVLSFLHVRVRPQRPIVPPPRDVRA